MTEPASRSILVSACLLGLETRYDGEVRCHAEVLDFLETNGWTPIPVCPEQLGGLPTPRPAAEFSDGDAAAVLAGSGRLINRHGEDVGAAFIKGARQTLAIAGLCRCTHALLKERSPSCGSTSVYRNGELAAGAGITATLLRQAGLKVYSEEDIAGGQLPVQEG